MPTIQPEETNTADIERIRPAVAADGEHRDGHAREQRSQLTVASSNHELVLREALTRGDRESVRRRVTELTSRLLATTGKGLDLGDADLGGLDLSGLDLRGANLNRARLHDTNFSGADLSLASIVCAGMERTKLDGACLRGAYVHALAAQVCSFRGADLSGLVDATGSLFHGCFMAGAKLGGSMLSGASFYQCDLEAVGFEGANLQGATINECILERADMSGALVSQMTVTKCRMTKAVLAGASGNGLVLQRPTACDGLVLEGAQLPGLRLDTLVGSGVRARGLGAPCADFFNCSFEEADFSMAALGASRWVSCSVPGIDLSGAKLEEAMFRGCSMKQANLEAALCENLHIVESLLIGARMAKLGGRCVTIRDSAMEGVDLREAYLYRAMITADPPRALAMEGADLRSANLVQAYVNADLRGADLRGANLTYSRLNQADLRGADLSGCNMFQSSMVKVNCTDARFNGVDAPIFVDRCAGLKESLQADSSQNERLARFVGDLEQVMRSARHGST